MYVYRFGGRRYNIHRYPPPYIYIYTHLFVLYLYTYIYTHTYMCIMYIQTYTYIRVYIYIYIYIHMRGKPHSLHIYIYICTHSMHIFPPALSKLRGNEKPILSDTSYICICQICIYIYMYLLIYVDEVEYTLDMPTNFTSPAIVQVALRQSRARGRRVRCTVACPV